MSRRSLLGGSTMLFAPAIIRPARARLFRNSGGDAYADGASGAPTGTVPFPTLLSGYTVRAPWNVAGVDYRVGPDSSVTLQDPAPGGVLASTLTSSGGSLSGSIITFSGASNATINGWDFSLHGGMQVLIHQDGMTIKNCLFKVGTSTQSCLLIGYSSSATGFTLINCEVDGGGVALTGGPQDPIHAGPAGQVTIQYCHIHNAYAQLIQCAAANFLPNSQWTVQYSAFGNAGLGKSASGVHGDMIQWVSSTAGIPDLNFTNFDWCLMYQTAPKAIAGTQGLNDCASGTGATQDVKNVSFTNNTCVCTTSSDINSFMILDSTHLQNTATFNNNYCDITGLSNHWYQFGLIGSTGPYSGTLNTPTGNVNMSDGSALT